MNGVILKNNKETVLLIKTKLIMRGNKNNPSFAFPIEKHWLKSGILTESKEYEIKIRVK